MAVELGPRTSMNDEAVIDVLWKMYQEHCTQGRHHETQRSTVMSVLIAISAAVVSIAGADGIAAREGFLLGSLLVVLGAFGAGFSMKHYERFSLHMERARAHRDALDALLPDKPLRHLKHVADSTHNKTFPRMRKWRLHYWWLFLNLFVACLGIALLVIAISSLLVVE